VLTDEAKQRVKAARPLRLAIAVADASETAGTLAARMAVPDRMLDTFLRQRARTRRTICTAVKAISAIVASRGEVGNGGAGGALLALPIAWCIRVGRVSCLVPRWGGTDL
jgi:hypothetical protein